jgi:hypothetical protein
LISAVQLEDQNFTDNSFPDNNFLVSSSDQFHDTTQDTSIPFTVQTQTRPAMVENSQAQTRSAMAETSNDGESGFIQVVAEGSGTTKLEALNSAWNEAVKLGVGMFLVSKTEVIDEEILKNR